MSEPIGRLQALLPSDERVVDLRSDGAVIAATVRDVEDRDLHLEWWRGMPERPSFRDGNILRFAYRGASDAIDLARVSRILDTLVAHEDELARFPVRRVEEPKRAEGRILFLREAELAVRLALARRRSDSLAAAMHALLEREHTAASLGHVMLYFETRCRQACEFCEEPGRRDRPLGRIAARALRAQHTLGADLVSLGVVGAILEWMHAREERPVFHVTGHDWLRHPHVDALLSSLERNPGVRLRLQGPSLELADPVFARRVASLPGLELVATTLQSSDPDEHDAMVGRAGAHRRLIAALSALDAAGARVLLTIVLTRRTLRTLGSTLAWLRETARDAQLQAFIPDRAMRDPEGAIAPLDELRAALTALPARARSAIASLVAVPPCAVPEALRHRIAPAIDTTERERASYGGPCERCTARGRCSGVPASYLRALGERGFAPLR